MSVYNKFITRFTNQFNAEFECDPSVINNIINVLQKCNLDELLNNVATKPTKTKDAKKAKKLTGYTYYLKLRCEELKEAKQKCSISTIAEEWHELNEDDRKEYKDLALEYNDH